MEKNTEKRLLYFDQCIINKFRLNDSTRIRVGHFICKDVKTGEIVTLGYTLFPKEVSKSLAIAEHYYDNIDNITNDYDLLWNLTEETFSPIIYTFEEVQAEYQRLIKDGVIKDEINSIIIELFKNKKKIK